MYKNYIKRIIDFVLALLLVIILSPLLIFIAIVIRLQDGGAAIFKQVRSGKNNKEFTLYKFRSMTVNNDFNDKSEEDKVTKIGAFIRKTSLDELPQLFNILKGEMSFIGPRPWVTGYAENFTKEQMHRLDVLPGITGLAQCSGRNNLTILDRINIDIEYVNNISFMLDVKIFFKTIKCILMKEGFSNSKSAIHEEIKVLENQHNKC